MPGKPDQENVHELPPNLLKEREVIIIDIAGSIPSQDYSESEDPSKFQSRKTKRGPLTPGWMDKVSIASLALANNIFKAYLSIACHEAIYDHLL